MKFVSILLAILLTVSFVAAQTPVDKFASAVDSLTVFHLNSWKVSKDLRTRNAISGDPTKPGFNDTGWSTLMLDQSIYPDSCWIRKEFSLPKTILGKKVHGKIRLMVSVDDYGYMFINGESKGYFPWDGEYVLTENAKPGEKFTIAIKAINTGGPLRLIHAQLIPEELVDIKNESQGLALSFQVGQKLLGFDTYQSNAYTKTDPHIDRSKTNSDEKKRLNELLQKLVGSIDLRALAAGNLDRYRASVDAVRKQLGPIRDFVKQYTLFFDSNAHIDAAWLWRSKETIAVCKNTFASVLNIMKAKPDFTYTQSAAAYYDWMERLYPELFAQIQEKVKEGRWELTGGMWIEPDCNLPDGVSWARHLLYAKSYFEKKFGKDVKLGWNPDSFGYNWNMPMFYSQAGIDAFITQKIGWNEVNVFPYRVFWWESPDKSRILSYFPFDYVNTIENPFQLVDWSRQLDANTGLKKQLVLFGVGDHGGGPSIEMITRIERLRKLDLYPNIEFGTSEQYLGWLRSQDLNSLPVWNDELYLEYHQGTFTTQANTKLANRRSETLLTNAEKFSTLATLEGGVYERDRLASAWEKVMFNQFHDILPGSSIRPVYMDAADEYKKVAELGGYELSTSLHTIAAQIAMPRVHGRPIVVFNSLGWNRSDVARVKLPEGDNESYILTDTAGVQIPSQIVTLDSISRELLFVAADVPALGYKLYELRKGTPAVVPTHLEGDASKLKNSYFEITLDSATGWIRGIHDLVRHREVLNGLGNQLQLLEDVPKAYDAWNIGWTGVTYPITYRHAEIVERGPVRIVLRVYHDFLKPGVKKDYPTENFPSTFFTQDIILYNDLPRIDFRTGVEWWENHTMLKVAFPLSVSDSVATYEIPYGSITRSTLDRTSWEKAKIEVPALRWADISSGGYGVSLLNTSKYGYDVKGNVIRLSLLRSPNSPDPTADRGNHSIEYSLLPHADTWKEARTVQCGYDLNTPLLVVECKPHEGKLPQTYSFGNIAPANVVLTSMKLAEESNAWIIQMYESNGKDTDAIVTLPSTVKRAELSNFLENDGANLTINGNAITVPMKSHGVATVKVYF